MVVRSDSSSAAAAAAARAEAARKAAEAKAKAAEEKARAERARQQREAQQAAQQAQQRQTASPEVQRGSRTRAAAGDQLARQRLQFAGSPDALDRNSAANARNNANTQTEQARQAAATANRDNRAADEAFGAHQEAQRALNTARERNAPADELRPLEERATEAETAFQEAERTAQASTDTAVREAEEALNAQRTANGEAERTGGEPPFPAANDVENVRDLAKASPDQQRAILGEEAAFTAHDATRVENRAAADEAREAVGPLQENARVAHDAVRDADARVADARQSLSDAEQARDRAPPDERQALNQAVNEARDNLSRVEGEAFEARKAAHEATDELLTAQHTANDKARDAGDPPPFAAAGQARTAEDVASLSAAEQREILGAESAISRSEASEVASAVRTDRVNEAASRINGESDPQRAAEQLTDALGGSNDARFRAELLESTRPAQESIGRHLTSDDLSDDDARALTDQLAQAGELAGQDHARTLTDGVAAGMSGDGLRGEVKDALENTVREGNGALFGVELAQSLQTQGKEDAAKDALEKTKHGIEAVQEEYAEASSDALAREGDLARTREQWAQSGAFSPAELDAGEAAFREEHRDTFDRFNDASETLASTLNGADAALRAYEDPNSNIREIDNDEGRKTRDAAREVMGHAPDLVYTETGQRALGEAAIAQGEGQRTWLQGANEYGRTLDGQEGEAFQDGMASATMQAAVSGMDQLAESGRASERSLAVQGAASALGDVDPDSVAGQMKGALQDIGDEVANVEANSAGLTPIQVSERLATGIDRAIGARFDVIETRQGGELTDAQRAARDRLSLVGTAAGVAGLGQATYELVTDPSVQTAARVASEGINVVSDVGQQEVLRRGRELGFADEQLTRATRPLRALAVAGGAIGIFTGETTLERVQAGTETAVGAAGLIGELSAFGAGATGARAAVGVGLRAVGKASLVVGLGFSAVDTYQAIRRGDVAGAAIAGAPIAGAAIGATVGSIVPGAGTLAGAGIGFAVGGVISIGAGLARSLFGESEEEKFEKRTDSFLEGALREAGLPESAAHRLRDVDGDFEGMGRTLAPLAEAAGTTPREVLETIARLPDGQLEDFVKSALDIPHNADDIKDAREKLAEGDDVDVPTFRLDTGSDEFSETLALLRSHLG